jgi:hypothetical protein
MKDLSEIFSNFEGTVIEVTFRGHGPDSGTLIESGRVVFSGTDYVALEPTAESEPEYIPFTAIRSFRALRR